jgi:D-glycero-D-manno-heptose 1,7-bisphosphate phosphatase
VFLDRDGVLNRAFVRNGKPFPPSTVDEVELLPGNSHACEALRQAGFLLIMVTNQPDVARGTQSRDVVEAINQSVAERLHLDLIKVCYHDDVDDCSCRKPKPGLLYEAADELQIDLSRSFMIGDRWKDIEAGRLAGCQTILIQTPYAERRAEAATQEVDSLSAAADFILRITHTQGEG